MIRILSYSVFDVMDKELDNFAIIDDIKQRDMLLDLYRDSEGNISDDVNLFRNYLEIANDKMMTIFTNLENDFKRLIDFRSLKDSI